MQDATRQIRRMQTFTAVWMMFEAGLSLWAAWSARSPALAAFGGDSAIEFLSAVVVLWRFRSHASESAERTAARIAGGLLFGLAVLVVLVSVLSLRGYAEAKPSLPGIAVLAAAALVMPVLATKKRRLSALTGSAALRADGAESALCAYFSVISLIGVAVNTFWHVAWADPAAALAVTPLIVTEGRAALRGRPCGCH